ncbi:MAG: hypothetical protein V4671_32670 [Armatimonadota bacterium]
MSRFSLSRLSPPQRWRRQITVLALSALIIGIGGGMAWQNDPSLFAGLPRFRSSASALKNPFPDLTFAPPDTDIIFGVPFIGARLIDDQIKINERYVIKTIPMPRRDAEMMNSLNLPRVIRAKHKTSTTLTQPKRKTPIWMGPVEEAQFVHDINGGVHTLKDRHGAILWTNATDVANADLVLQSTESGESRLLGKKGKLLWQGNLPDEMRPPKATPVVPRRRDKKAAKVAKASPGVQGSQSHHSSLLVDTYHRVCYGYGIHINGVNGQFTITDNAKRHLWTGTLPNCPTVLLRRGHHFSFSGTNGSMGDMDRVVQIRFAVEKGEAVIRASDRPNEEGSRPITFLKTFQETLLPEGQPVRVFKDTPRLTRPRPIVRYGKSMSFTFKDSTGKTVGTGSVSGDNGSPLAISGRLTGAGKKS